MCFSEQLRRVGSCCLAVGWCQGATPFGVPIKTGVGFTAQEADHREWSLSMCRIWSLGSVLFLAALCMHVGRGFSGKEQGTGLSCPCCRYKFWGQALPCAGSLFPGTLPSSSRCSCVPYAPLRALGCLHMTWKWREFPPNTECVDKSSFLECFISKYSIFWDV